MTTKASHTPGPWIVADPGSNFARHQRYIRAQADLGTNKVAVATVCNRGGKAEREANALLIAAAPAMLEALLEWKRLWDMNELQPHYSSQHDEFDKVLKLTQAALALAEKKTP